MFTIIIPYFDSNSSYRQRNLLTVIENYRRIASDIPIIIVEQNGTGNIKSIVEKYEITHMNVELPYELFHKTRLLNYAIDNCDSEYIIMADADCILTQTAIHSIKTEYANGSILYPFNSVDYYNEAHTRKMVRHETIEKSYKKTDRGLPIKRFTGMVNCFSRGTYTKIGKFDESVVGWGSEDDIFLMKCERLISPSYRTQLDSPLIHMFHPKSDTEDYKNSQQFKENKKISALIKRMSIEDLILYSQDSNSLPDLIKKYENLGKLNLIIKWTFRNVVVTFDSTIYDMESFDNMSIGKILRTIYDVDGYDFMMSIVKEVQLKVTDLSIDDNNQINECIALCPLSHGDGDHITK